MVRGKYWKFAGHTDRAFLETSPGIRVPYFVGPVGLSRTIALTWPVSDSEGLFLSRVVGIPELRLSLCVRPVREVYAVRGSGVCVAYLMPDEINLAG
jgi:hypothetical protein